MLMKHMTAFLFALLSFTAVRTQAQQKFYERDIHFCNPLTGNDDTVVYVLSRAATTTPCEALAYMKSNALNPARFNDLRALQIWLEGGLDSVSARLISINAIAALDKETPGSTKASSIRLQTCGSREIKSRPVETMELPTCAADHRNVFRFNGSKTSYLARRQRGGIVHN